MYACAVFCLIANSDVRGPALSLGSYNGVEVEMPDLELSAMQVRIVCVRCVVPRLLPVCRVCRGSGLECGFCKNQLCLTHPPFRPYIL